MDKEKAEQIIKELKEHCWKHMETKLGCEKCLFVNKDKVCIFYRTDLPNYWRFIDLPNI